MPDKLSELELVETTDASGYPINWVVNRSDRGIQSLTFWAGCVFYEGCRQRATAIPPHSYFQQLSSFIEPGRQISAVEELIWDDGSTQSFFPMPRSTGEDGLTGAARADVGVQHLERDQAIWDRLLKALGWA